MSAGYKWKPLQRARWPREMNEAIVAAFQKQFGVDRQGAIARIEEENAKMEVWKNDLYQVTVERRPEDQSVHLCIRRCDGYPGRDWRHFQQIKNELVGPECEGVELYPAESRLTDEANKYHLWCCTDPAFRFPFGYRERNVSFGDETEPGLRQRPPMQMAGGAK